jgi:hypothetical protein
VPGGGLRRAVLRRAVLRCAVVAGGRLRRAVLFGTVVTRGVVAGGGPRGVGVAATDRLTTGVVAVEISGTAVEAVLLRRVTGARRSPQVVVTVGGGVLSVDPPAVVVRPV